MEMEWYWALCTLIGMVIFLMAMGVPVFNLARKEDNAVIQERALSLLYSLHLVQQIAELLDLPDVDLLNGLKLGLLIIVVRQVMMAVGMPQV